MHPWTKAGYGLAGILTALVVIVALATHLLIGKYFDAVPRAIAMSVAIMAGWLGARIAAIAQFKWLRYLSWFDVGCGVVAAVVWCWVSPWTWDDSYNTTIVHFSVVAAQAAITLAVGLLVGCLASTYYAQTDPRWLKIGTFICIFGCIAAGLSLSLATATYLSLAWTLLWSCVAIALCGSIVIAFGMSHKRVR